MRKDVIIRSQATTGDAAGKATTERKQASIARLVRYVPAIHGAVGVWLGVLVNVEVGMLVAVLVGVRTWHPKKPAHSASGTTNEPAGHPPLIGLEQADEGG